MGYKYLASPYTHANPAIMHTRWRCALHATAALICKGEFIYSPIVHCHELAQAHKLPRDFKFWKKYNFTMLEKADMLLILRIDGWEQSKGIAAEKEFAEELGIPWELV